MSQTPRATLLLVLHSHQPVGNFDHVFAECTEQCYHPTLEALWDFPTVRLTLHTTGPLLEWLANNRPDTIELMAKLSKRNQIEILGGTHNEAMASVLPDRDVIGQVRAMQRWCETHLEQSPRGMWLAERVWEPDLPRVLHQAGVEYTLLDDVGFRFAGITDETVWGHYATEKAGHPLTLFPIDQQLRYLIPFKEPHEVLNHLRETSEKAGEHVWMTYGDDGEKFGVWPGTQEWVFGDGQWLRRFFQALTDAQDWCTTATLADAVDRFPSRGRVYLPTCSYDEMMEWAQTPETAAAYHQLKAALQAEGRWDAVRGFIGGGIWQNFLARYEEADRMHKRMIQVSERLDRLRTEAANRPWLEDDLHIMHAAQQELYRSQCNDAFWHGLFGGLYLSNLRHKTWAHMLAADVLLDKIAPLDGNPEWMDIDLDGRAECLLADTYLHVTVQPHRGGAITELSFKPRSFCLTDTLSRRPEHYHAALLQSQDRQDGGDAPKSIHDVHHVKEEGLADLLVYDEDGAFSILRDRFLSPNEGVARFAADARVNPLDIGDFAAGEYATGVTDDGVELTRQGQVGDRGVSIIKSIALDGGGGLTVDITLWVTDGGGPLSVVYAPEMCFNLLAPEAHDRYYLADGVRTEDPRMISRGAAVASTLSMVDEWSRVRLDLVTGWVCTWWRAPIQTVSASESGIERIYQGSMLLARWTGELTAEPTRLSMTIRATELPA